MKRSELKSLYVDYASFWNSLDKRSEETRKEYNVSCKQGCNYCCKHAVIISIPEALAMMYGIRSSKDDANYYDAWIVQKIYKQRLMCLSMVVTAASWFSNQRPCVFLKGNGDCWCYDYRPGECRVLLVGTPPENCGPPAGQKIVPYVPTKYLEHSQEISKKWAGKMGIPVGKSPLPMAMYWANMIYHRGRDLFLSAIKDTAFENDRTALLYWGQRFGSKDMEREFYELTDN